MYTVYVLYSARYDKIYIGYTSNMEQRFLSHNELGKKGWTVKYRPWHILYTEQYDEKSEALLREKFLKSGRGRAWIREELVTREAK
jgi:putative endonuclease